MSKQEKQRIINSIVETSIIPHLKSIEEHIPQDINIPSITKSIKDLEDNVKYMDNIASLELLSLIKMIHQFKTNYNNRILPSINNPNLEFNSQSLPFNTILNFVHSTDSSDIQKKRILIFTSIQIIMFLSTVFICFKTINNNVARDLVAISLKEFCQAQPWILTKMNPISKLLSFIPTESLDSKNELQTYIMNDLNDPTFMKHVFDKRHSSESFTISDIQRIFLQNILKSVGVQNVATDVLFSSNTTKQYFMKHCSLAVISPLIIIKKLYIGKQVPLLFAISDDKKLVFYPYKKIEEFKTIKPQQNTRQQEQRKYPYGGFFPFGRF